MRFAMDGRCIRVDSDAQHGGHVGSRLRLSVHGLIQTGGDNDTCPVLENHVFRLLDVLDTSSSTHKFSSLHDRARMLDLSCCRPLHTVRQLTDTDLSAAAG